VAFSGKLLCTQGQGADPSDATELLGTIFVKHMGSTPRPLFFHTSGLPTVT
jgi:hypothetical protein